MLWAHAKMARAGLLALRGPLDGVPQRESERRESEDEVRGSEDDGG
jgi:hypothetical protein